MNKGSVEWPNMAAFVIDITMRDGAFILHCQGIGPCEEYHGPVRVYGPDAVLMMDGGAIDVPAAKPKQVLVLNLVCTPESPIALEE